jgi:hypothetical protein
MVADKKKPEASKKIQTPDTPGSIAAAQSMRNYLLIAIGVATLAVLVGGYFIYNLAQANIRKALEVRAQEYQIKLSEKKIEQIAAAEPELQKIKLAEANKPSKFDFITQRTLPENEDFESVLTIFNRLQKDKQVNVESISKQGSGTNTTSTAAATTETGSASGAAQPNTVTIKASAAPEAMFNFLAALETSARTFDFSTMKISSAQGSLTLDITYKVYSMGKPSIDDTAVKIDEYENDKEKYEK